MSLGPRPSRTKCSSTRLSVNAAPAGVPQPVGDPAQHPLELGDRVPEASQPPAQVADEAEQLQGGLGDLLAGVAEGIKQEGGVEVDGHPLEALVHRAEVAEVERLGFADDPSSATYSSLVRFTWRVVPENHRRVMGVRIGDQDTRAA